MKRCSVTETRLPQVDELKRSVKQTQALVAYGGESSTNQGFWMGFSEMFANYEWVTSYVDNIAAVTPDDVQRIAQQYLQPINRIVGIYHPHKKGNNNQ